jgi:hypothetical protein
MVSIASIFLLLPFFLSPYLPLLFISSSLYLFASILIFFCLFFFAFRLPHTCHNPQAGKEGRHLHEDRFKAAADAAASGSG